MRISFRRGDGWWPFAVGLAFGMLLAFPFAAPLIGSVLPEAAATLWGSALGAVAAVASALWVAQRTERVQRRNASALVISMLDPYIRNIEQLRKLYGEPSVRSDPALDDREPEKFLPPTWQDIKVSADSVIAEITKLKKTAHRIDSVLAVLGPVALERFLLLEDTLDEAVLIVSRIRADAVERGVRMYGESPSWKVRKLLAELSTNVSAQMMALKMAVR